MKKAPKIALAGALAVIAGAGVYHLFWGKLFPYAPFFPGFEESESPRAVFHVQRGARFDEARALDSWIAAVEEAHGLAFVRKPRILVFRDDRSYLRRSVSRTRFIAYQNGTIAVSPWGLREAGEGRISLEIYLKHELSHALLFQHMKPVAAYVTFPRWLLEGLAVSRSGQMGTSWYPGKAETLDLIRRGNFLPPGDFNKKRGRRAALDVPNRSAFLYAEFACLVEALIESQGEEKFEAYVRLLMRGRRPGAAFSETFGTDFDAFLRDFRANPGGRDASPGHSVPGP